ncbi:hypothetical protein ACTWPT_37825 [Nonomuraea sp. 3N208]|uniref:hypothetical protein n=1 Tax=Nonomuraea sp. 3N208 TaxID=3457421 RepID=UPI003FD6AF86
MPYGIMPGCLSLAGLYRLSHSAFTGISRKHLGHLIEEIAPRWTSRRQDVLTGRRGHERPR